MFAIVAIAFVIVVAAIVTAFVAAAPAFVIGGATKVLVEYGVKKFFVLNRLETVLSVLAFYDPEDKHVALLETFHRLDGFEQRIKVALVIYARHFVKINRLFVFVRKALRLPRRRKLRRFLFLRS